VKRNHTMPAKVTRQTQPATPADGLEAEIRARAFELYEQRGRDGGHELDDWLQATAEGEGSERVGKVPTAPGWMQATCLDQEY
jgi:hypothetical protein